MKIVKRLALAVVAVVVVVVIGFAGMMASVFSGNQPMPETGPFAASTASSTASSSAPAILIKDGYVAVYAVPVGDQHVALIDCGNDVEATAVLAALSSRQLTVDAIFLTHAHPDHTHGCAAILRAFPNAMLAASQRELPTLAGAPFRGLLPRLVGNKPSGLVVTRALGDQEDVVVGSATITAIAVAGHTAGSMVYVANGVVFFGDAATGASDGHIKPPPGPFSDDVSQGVASLHALVTRLGPDVTTFAFAHSGPLPADLAKLGAVSE